MAITMSYRFAVPDRATMARQLHYIRGYRTGHSRHSACLYKQERLIELLVYHRKMALYCSLYSLQVEGHARIMLNPSSTATGQPLSRYQ